MSHTARGWRKNDKSSFFFSKKTEIYTTGRMFTKMKGELPHSVYACVYLLAYNFEELHFDFSKQGKFL